MVSEAQAEKQRADSEREAARLWRAFRTTLQMVRDRGYILTDEEVNATLADFIHKYTGADGHIDVGRLKYSATPTQELHERMKLDPNDPGGRSDSGTIWVEFNNDDNVGIKQVRSFATFLSGHNYHTGILVTKVHITSSALRIVPSVSDTVRIETFQEVDLLVNITQHELVPQHAVLSKIEKAALLKRYRLKETQLPRIQYADPVAKYYGLRRGQVVKIIRKSETAGRYASYRLCV